MHKTKGNGQLNGLGDRMSKHQLAKRATKIEARKTVAQALYSNQNELAAAIMGIFSVLKRGFFGRLKWLLFGR